MAKIYTKIEALQAAKDKAWRINQEGYYAKIIDYPADEQFRVLFGGIPERSEVSSFSYEDMRDRTPVTGNPTTDYPVVNMNNLPEGVARYIEDLEEAQKATKESSQQFGKHVCMRNMATDVYGTCYICGARAPNQARTPAFCKHVCAFNRDIDGNCFVCGNKVEE